MANKNLFDFACEHPYITWFIVVAAIEAPANIIKAIKWDGHCIEQVAKVVKEVA